MSEHPRHPSPAHRSEEASKKGPKQRLRTFMREWVVPIGATVLVLGTFRSAVADWLHVPTGSMLPSIVEGDRIFVNKMAYDVRVPFTRISVSRRDEPEAGEVVLVRSPEEEGTRLVKRVIGVPGDEIAVRDGRLIRNGAEVPLEPTGWNELQGELGDRFTGKFRLSVETLGESRHPVLSRAASAGTTRWRAMALENDFGPVLVPEESYFVMGDNRDLSRDSRAFGFVERSAFLGRVVGIAFSLDPERHGLPRMDRIALTVP